MHYGRVQNRTRRVGALASRAGGDHVRIRAGLVQRGDNEHVVEAQQLIRAVGLGEKKVVVRATGHHVVKIRCREAGRRGPVLALTSIEGALSPPPAPSDLMT